MRETKRNNCFSWLRFASNFGSIHFMDKKTAKKQAAQITSDMEGPVGRVPLERVLAKHIGFFNDLRSDGATWPQIAALLKRAGLTRKDGAAIEASQIRATISRISSQGNQKAVAREKPTKSPTQIKERKPDQKGGRSSLRLKMQQAAKARRL